MKGFSAVPRYLGTDERGRDILTYIPGSVGKWQFYSDDAIRLAGQLLRAFHDATAGSELLLGKPVMCHHDPGPNNFVFQGSPTNRFYRLRYDRARRAPRGLGLHGLVMVYLGEGKSTTS